jgi:hypothetical protein
MISYYDPERNKIVGAKPGSLIWWHERGHQEVEHKAGLCSFQIQIFQHIIVICLLFLAIGEPLGAQVVLGFWVVLVFINELAAWVYAFWHKPPFKGKRD